MPAYQLDQFLPDIDPSWIAPCATIIGNVVVGIGVFDVRLSANSGAKTDIRPLRLRADFVEKVFGCAG